MADIREYIDLKFDMFADKVTDLTKQVTQLAEAVIRIATLEERQKSSDASTEKAVEKLETRQAILEDRLNKNDIENARKQVYFTVINCILSATITGFIALGFKFLST